MKKIGIITFHRSDNCGSILQAYALQKALVSLGHQPECIDFSNKGQEGLYRVIRPMRNMHSVLVNISRIPQLKRLIENRKSYRNYVQSHIKVSQLSYRKTDELNEGALPYDVYVAGSDQVWNITIADADDAYFLSFVHSHPKVAYAVSQGARDIARHARNPSKYTQLISAFNAVSVREPNGKKWIRDLCGFAPDITLDPTLLFDAEDYCDIEHRGSEEGFVFVYSPVITKTQLGVIRAFAVRKGLKVVIWHTNVWFKHLGWLRGDLCPRAQDPGKYLYLIKNADYVFTSSFHGVVFSCTFRKQFVVLDNDGIRLSDDDRMTSFLENFSLSNRIADGREIQSVADVKVDYSVFKSKLLAMRKKSLAWLDHAVTKDNDA